MAVVLRAEGAAVLHAADFPIIRITEVHTF